MFFPPYAHTGPTTLIISEKKSDSTEVIMFRCFSISHYVVTSWNKGTVREWDSVTDRGRGRRASLAVTAFSLLMNDVLLPPQHSLGLQSVNLSRVIWRCYCANLEYSSGSFFASRAQTPQGSHNISPLYGTVVDIDVVWCLVWSWVSGFRWMHTVQ